MAERDKSITSIDDVPMDRQNEILRRIIQGEPPVENETSHDLKLRKQLEIEVAEIRARGQIPSIPFD